MENHFNGLLAKERLVKGKSEMKVLELEQELEEMKKQLQANKENTKPSSHTQMSSKASSDKELS